MENPEIYKAQNLSSDPKLKGYCVSCCDPIHENEKSWQTRDGLIHDTRDCKLEQMYKEFKISQIVDDFKDRINKLSTKEFLEFVDDYELEEELISLSEDYDWRDNE